MTAEKVGRSSTRMAHRITKKPCMPLKKHTSHKNNQITVKASWRERVVTVDEEKELQCITPGSMGISPQERENADGHFRYVLC